MKHRGATLSTLPKRKAAILKQLIHFMQHNKDDIMASLVVLAGVFTFGLAAFGVTGWALATLLP